MNFLTPQAPGTDSKKLEHGTVVGLPNGSTTITTNLKNLLLPETPPAACKVEIWPFRQTLISIPQLCQNNFKVTFDKEKATIYSQTGNPALTWKLCPFNNLFLLPIGPSSSHKIPSQKFHHSANNVQISTLDSKQNLAIWYHRICFSLVVTTWIKGINAGFFSTWTGLTSKLITKNLPPSVNTALGHPHQQYQNTWSTKKLSSLSSHPSSIKKPTMHLYFSSPPTQSFLIKQALSPSFQPEDITT